MLEEPDDENDTCKSHINSNRGVLLDSVENRQNLLRHSQDDVDEKEIVSVGCDNAGVVWMNPEGPQREIDEGECKSLKNVLGPEDGTALKCCHCLFSDRGR